MYLYFQLIAKGKTASELFPAVVKNVASKNIEVNTIFTLFSLLDVVIHLSIVQQKYKTGRYFCSLSEKHCKKKPLFCWISRNEIISVIKLMEFPFKCSSRFGKRKNLMKPDQTLL